MAATFSCPTINMDSFNPWIAYRKTKIEGFSKNNKNKVRLKNNNNFTISDNNFKNDNNSSFKSNSSSNKNNSSFSPSSYLLSNIFQQKSSILSIFKFSFLLQQVYDYIFIILGTRDSSLLSFWISRINLLYFM